ncbi:MAG: NADH-quinone oxidoreductase subunit C [Armatimonadetes bacterium]|nr:NADH-quinone oxidoreductase subunit C [Anaerolineae bacterium]
MTTQIVPALNPVSAVQAWQPDAVVEVVEFRGETTLVLDSLKLLRVMQYLRDTPGLIYNFLSDVSAVDYWEQTGGDSGRPARFGVCYHLYSMLYNRRLRVKVYLEEDAPSVMTVTSVWPAANWLEREINDMMGINFEGHPDLRRLLMPDDWDGHPHRRDYPLGYETIQFSFNIEDILKHKPFAHE